MYIRKVIIKNFRVFGEEGIEIVLSKGTNAIIGPNNAGKSAIIDALRIVFSPCEEYKSIYFCLNDFHVDRFGKRCNEALISLEFCDVDASFMEIIDPDSANVGYMNYKFYIEINKLGLEKVKYKVWGGKNELNILSQEVIENNFFVPYLNALRNVDNEFKPSKNSRFSNLINGIYHNSDDEKQKLVDTIKVANDSLINEKKIISAKDIINKNIKEIEGDFFNQKISFEFVEPKFENIISSIKGALQSDIILIPKDKLDDIKKCPNIEKYLIIKDEEVYLQLEKAKANNCFSSNDALFLELSKYSYSLDLVSNGLGYNNIIYMASVLGDIESIKYNNLTNILLIEEPEAHLHPQLQALLQNYLDRTAKKNIQIIYTTHSPSMASNCKLESINFITNNFKPRATSVNKLRIHENEKYRNYIRSFLDVTKSQLLFSKGAIFVEGVTEAILLSKFSELLGKSLTDYQIEIVNVDGVSFEPFASLITCVDGKAFLPAVIITDDDRCTDKGDSETYIGESINYDYSNIKEVIEKLQNGRESARCTSLIDTFSGTNVKIFKAFKTLEYELIKNNLDVCLNLIKEDHSIIYNKIQKFKLNETKEIVVARLWLVFKNNPHFKASFARKLYDYITEKQELKEKNYFIVPGYLKEAIDCIIEMVKYEIK